MRVDKRLKKRLIELKDKYKEKMGRDKEELKDIPLSDFEQGLYKGSELVCKDIIWDIDRILKDY